MRLSLFIILFSFSVSFTVFSHDFPVCMKLSMQSWELKSFSNHREVWNVIEENCANSIITNKDGEDYAIIYQLIGKRFEGWMTTFRYSCRLKDDEVQCLQEEVKREDIHPGCLVDHNNNEKIMKSNPSFFWKEFLLKDINCEIQRLHPNLKMIRFHLGRETGRYGHRYAVGACFKSLDQFFCFKEPFKE